MLQPDVRGAARTRSSAAATQHNSGVDYSIILCDESVGCVGASGSDFARNSLRESIPLLSRFIPLLFGCYSAVIRLLFRCYSAVRSAVIPLSVPRSRVGNSPKYLNQQTFSRR